MDSSDDEAETLPELVTNYYFLDHDDDPVSFFGLPLLWSEHDSVNPNENSGGLKGGVFLHGTADNGLRTIYREIQAWKIDLNNVNPEISVLSKENNWFKLQKPRKSYEDTVRSVLITVNCLHYLKRNPESSGKSLWDSMAKVFSLYEVKPGAKDLADHTSLIKEAVKRDDSLAKCKFITTVLEEKPWTKKLNEGVQSAPKAGFIVEDDVVEVVEDDPDAEEDEDVFDSVCAICDNGGDLLCCEGRCMRSFHATAEAGEDSLCESLGLTDAEVEAIQQFLCKNCEYKQHQCLVCGKLGSSDKSSGAEVFACVSATCGRFYHPLCVAKLLHPKDDNAARELQKTIAEGKSFTCPIHKCCVCGKGEKKKTPELQFAVCRRCPRSYHRKCLPKGIAFEDSEEDVATRAWEGLLPNRILIYCLKHALDEELGTPVRNHIKFSHTEEKKTAASVKRKKPTPELSSRLEKKVAEKKSPASNEFMSRKSMRASDQKERRSSLASGSVKGKRVQVSSNQDIPRKAKMANVTGQSQKNSKKVGSVVGGKSSAAKKKEGTVSLGEMLFSLYMEGSENEQVQAVEEDEPVASKDTPKQLGSSLPKLDAASERRIQDIIKEATSSVSMQDVLDKHKIPSTHNTQKSNVDKAITMGKLEGAVEAVRTALQKIEEGGSIEDAQAVCDPDVLSQLFKWKDKLKVYLSPFIFGMRYTSFGRHFTKVDKLQEIVDKLHWYVQNGDTVVDFCCGANDFSWLLAKKLEESGKKCSYKNYDLFPAKNTFNFEKRDWMTVKPKELPPGHKLIMGLNPPFAVNAALANKFIDKALEFKPKLLILIVPPETQRLDKKKTVYDLVWEDDHFLSGKSFYLPGSVDENDKQMDQWNLNSPVLFLWSRPGWTSKHKAIARKQGHIVEELNRAEQTNEIDRSKQVTVPSSSDDNIPRQNNQAIESKENPAVCKGRKGSLSRRNHRKESPKNQENQSYNGSTKRGRNGSCEEICHPSPRETNVRSPANANLKQSSDMSLDADVGGSNNQPHDESLNPESDIDYALGLDSIVEDIGRTYGLNYDDHQSTERLSTSLSPHTEYRAQNLEEPHRGYSRERADVYGSSSIVEADERAWNLEESRRGYSRERADVYGSSSIMGADERARNLDDPGRGYSRDQADGFGSSSTMEVDGFGYSSTLEADERYWRDLDIRTQVRLYGRQDRVPSPRTSLPPFHQDPVPSPRTSLPPFLQDPVPSPRTSLPPFHHDLPYPQEPRPISSSYGLLPPPIPEPSYRMNTSAIQRYAPRLDELNPSRIGGGGLGPDPLGINRPHAIYDPRAPPQPGYQGNQQGFASGPYLPFNQTNSSGWLNE